MFTVPRCAHNREHGLQRRGKQEDRGGAATATEMGMSFIIYLVMRVRTKIKDNLFGWIRGEIAHHRTVPPTATDQPSL